MDIPGSQQSNTDLSIVVFHLDNEKNINRNAGMLAYPFGNIQGIKMRTTFGLTGFLLLFIFLVGLLVVLGIVFKLLFMLLPVIIVVILFYMLFRYLNKLK